MTGRRARASSVIGRWRNANLENTVRVSSHTNASIADAATEMIKHSVASCAVVDESGVAIGILTASNIVRQVIAHDLDPAEVSCTNLIQKRASFIGEGKSPAMVIDTALECMLSTRVEDIIVTGTNGEFQYILTLWPLVCHLVSLEKSSWWKGRKMRKVTMKTSFILEKQEKELHDLRQLRHDTDAREVAKLLLNDDYFVGMVVSDKDEQFLITEESYLKLISFGYVASRVTVGEIVERNEMHVSLAHSHEVKDCLKTLVTMDQKYWIMKTEETNSYKVANILMLFRLGVLAVPTKAINPKIPLLTFRSCMTQHEIIHVPVVQVASARKPKSPSLPRLIIPTPQAAASSVFFALDTPLLTGQSQRQLNRGDLCVSEEDYEAAFKIYSDYIGRHPKNGSVLYKRGKLHLEHYDKPKEAVRDFLRAIECKKIEDNEKQDATFHVIEQFLNLGYIKDAHRAWTTYGVGQNHDLQSRLYERYLNDIIKAKRDLEICWEKDEFEKALKSSASTMVVVEFFLVHRCQVDKESVYGLYVVRGECKLRLGNLEGALRDFKVAEDWADTNPADIQKLITDCERAIALEISVQNLSESIEKAFQKGVRNTKLAKMYSSRASLYMEQQAHVKASNDFARAVANDVGVLDQDQITTLATILRPTSGDDSLHTIISTFARERCFEEIRQIAKLARFPAVSEFCEKSIREIIDSHRCKALEYVQTRRFGSGILELKAAIEAWTFLTMSTENNELGADLHHYRGECYLSVQETQFALADFEVAISLSPAHERSWIKRCLCFEESGDESLFIKTAVEASHIFGDSNERITELVSRALASKPTVASETKLITCDDLFLS